jgi:hypothetical protein
MTKSQAGRKGGQTTAKRYGRQYMSQLGKRGAIAFWKLYKLSPIGLSNFAIVKRTNGEIIGYTNGGRP